MQCSLELCELCKHGLAKGVIAIDTMHFPDIFVKDDFATKNNTLGFLSVNEVGEERLSISTNTIGISRVSELVGVIQIQ